MDYGAVNEQDDLFKKIERKGEGYEKKQIKKNDKSCSRNDACHGDDCYRDSGI